MKCLYSAPHFSGGEESGPWESRIGVDGGPAIKNDEVFFVPERRLGLGRGRSLPECLHRTWRCRECMRLAQGHVRPVPANDPTHIAGGKDNSRSCGREARVRGDKFQQPAHQSVNRHEHGNDSDSSGNGRHVRHGKSITVPSGSFTVPPIGIALTNSLSVSENIWCISPAGKINVSPGP